MLSLVDQGREKPRVCTTRLLMGRVLPVSGRAQAQAGLDGG